MADLLALIFFLIASVWLSLRTGKVGWLVAASVMIGQVVYSLLTVGVPSDARTYYRVGREYLSTGAPPLNFGTDFMNFLSYAVQSWLPVSLYGLAWLFLGVKLLVLPKVQSLPVKANFFFVLLATSPNAVIWTGLYSKDLLSIIATFLSVGAYAAFRQGKILLWLFMVASGIAIEVGARPYMIPMILVPHLVVMWMHLHRVLLQSRFQRLPVGAALLLPLAFAGALAAIPLVTQYIGIQDLSQVSDRIEQLTKDLDYGNTAMILHPVERIFLLAAPAPYRVQHPLMIAVSLVSLAYLLWLLVGFFKLGRNGDWVKLDKGLVAFCVTGLALWTFAYWGSSNMGYLERMKGQILPYLFLLMAHVAWADRVGAGMNTPISSSPVKGLFPPRDKQSTMSGDSPNQQLPNENRYP